MSTATAETIEEGTLSFTIESRILRELGERLVKQPEVALLELVKNAYDADAKVCEITHEPPAQIEIADDGHGMTLGEFKSGWMRIGTSSKEASPSSRIFARVITGEKGIGRFAVRFLGKALHLESVAFDKGLGELTRLSADFNWPEFDRNEDLGKVKVPYHLSRAHQEHQIGTRLIIRDLRPNAEAIDMRTVRTAAIGIVTPYQSLLRLPSPKPKSHRQKRAIALNTEDPGFLLRIRPAPDDSEDGDLARIVLNSFVLRAVVELQADRLKLVVYRKGEAGPSIEINDRYENSIGPLYADIRFFPQRKGTFTGLEVDGRRAKSWVKDHSGIAVFDRTFRVHPYGTETDDWLFLSADTAKRAREPRSSVAKKHFPMDEVARMSTQLNYMLRLPYPQQLVGIAQVEGRRTKDQAGNEDFGLIASADREGFVDNGAFRKLRDIIRGATEAIASADRELQQDQERAEQDELLRALHTETQDAIKEIQANPNIARAEKARIVSRLAQTQLLAQEHDERSRQREAALETMSLLGVVAGFMTHEFGIAFDELKKAQETLDRIARRDDSLKQASRAITGHLERLQEFVTYSQGYIRGASSRPAQSYPAKPRIQQVIRVFGKYALDREIVLEIEAERDLMAPLVPVSLYNGIALNLFTNALKAVTAMSGDGPRRIAFRAWNESENHFLEVSDTGVGVPAALRQRIFDPLFTTTSSNRDPLGSGMGLGLSLVKRGVEAYGGRVAVVEPPAGFTTCFRIRLPLEADA
jgi:signal transduction histidine kinase